MSYNAEKMWDSPRPSFGAFRGRTGESYSPRWPHGLDPRMRGRSPLPFRGGAVPPGPPYTSQGGVPFSYRDAGRGQEGAWEESRPAPKEQMNILRRGAQSANFRDVADMHYSEQGLAPDMDYREREVLEQRKWKTPDVDYRAEEGQSIGYRVRLPPPDYRDQDTSEYRRKLIAEKEHREREILELEHRKRLATALDYRQRHAAEMEYKLRLDGILNRREREEEILLRERDYAERLLREREVLERMRDRDAVAMVLRDREAKGLALRDREAAALLFREREVMDYSEGGLPVRVRESTDLDLRVKEADKDFMGRERDLEYQESLPRKYSESGTLSYQQSLSRQYSESGTTSIPYREQKKTDLEYMEVEHQEKDALNAGTAKGTAVNKKSAEMPYRQGKAAHVSYEKGESQAQMAEFPKHTDTDYREKECADSDYRGKESSDSDYRSRENADVNYRDLKTTNVNYQQEAKTADVNYRDTKTSDSDYRGKESVDSDYRERESTDTDYRHSAVKESTEKMETGSNFLASNMERDEKAKSTAGFPLLPKEMDGKTGPKKVETIPFLSFSEEELSSLASIIAEAQSKPPTEVQAPSSSKQSCPGKLDTDFRERPKPEVNSGAKEPAEKASGYAAHGTPKELCSGDQDLRSKDSFPKVPIKVEADQDLRTSAPVQKDEDLRGGDTKTPEEFFAQNSLLMDFLRLAAKELRGKTNVPEAKDEPTTLAPAVPAPSAAAAETFHPDLVTRPARPLGPGSSLAPGIEYLCGEDIDYRNMDFNDVDLRVSHRPDKRLAEKRAREDPQPGSKDKDYRRTPIPEGATKVIWLEGLPTGASREEILCALRSAHNLPETSVNLIGYLPGYSLGSVCVEFSLVEEAVGCMEANKGVLHFRGKKVNLKYIPNSDRWTCLQCNAVNVLSKERCWQCSALRAGTDHLPIVHKDPKTPPVLTTTPQRSKKRKSKRSPSGCSPDRWKDKTPPRERSPPPKITRAVKRVDSQSATVIIRGICVTTSPGTVVKALKPYVQLSPSCVRIMKNRKSNHRGFGFIDLKNHKEAIRLTVLVRDMKPPLTIDGKTISVDLAVGQRRTERKSWKGNKSSPGKNRKQRGQRKPPFAYPGFRAEEGPSYIFDPKTGCYVDPLTDSVYNEPKSEQKRDDYPNRDSEKDAKEKPSRTRRGFTEETEEEEAFKRPLPPPVPAKKEEPAQPIVNPLLGLLGAYVEDSDEEEEEEEEEESAKVILPQLQKKKPASPPPPPVAKLVPKPIVFPVPKPIPKPAPKPILKPILKPAPIPKPQPKLPAPATSSITDYDKLIDWKKLVCLLCRRQFPSKDTLMKHKNLSDLHKKNIAIQEKMRKSQKQLAYLQQREQEENQCIQRRLLQAKKELEMLEREEEGAQQEADEGLDLEVCTFEKRKAKGEDTRSELLGDKSERKRLKSSGSPKPAGESYRENMKRLILERYKELE
ncbi:RNA-binding protein 6-like [Rana temporaria]|uniref:RNA-binding protein 6-like n=1 Tax=Rana temporaria TaxID=8407 RepID=UPI001AAC8C47|nr:RNA-binding protein 6-like [Rana temporaria]